MTLTAVVVAIDGERQGAHLVAPGSVLSPAGSAGAHAHGRSVAHGAAGIVTDDAGGLTGSTTSSPAAGAG